MHYLFGSVAFCVLLGVIGSATAPASTMMTIRQYNAKGLFVDTILQVTALDDAFALIAFSVSAAFLQASETGHLSLSTLLLPLFKNGLSIALGFGTAFGLKYLIAKRNSDDHRLVVLMIAILGLSGVCSVLSVSPLLSCMVLGGTYRNISDDEQLFRLLNFFAPPVLLIFFVVSGMKLDLSMLRTAGLMGVFYFFIRIVGNTSVPCRRLDDEDGQGDSQYLGMALTPQAGIHRFAALGQRLRPPTWRYCSTRHFVECGALR